MVAEAVAAIPPLRRGRGGPRNLKFGVLWSRDGAAAANPKYNLVAGTSWLFSSKEMRNAPVDVLIIKPARKCSLKTTMGLSYKGDRDPESAFSRRSIDEAGQLSLADAVAASSSARNMLLLGDPLQLAQVSKGVHPGGAGASVLEHVLDDEATISPERGVFLGETRRMHRAVCGFISSQFYEGRLSSYGACNDQRIEGVEAGLVWLKATHVGRSTDSLEEAELVTTAILELLGREWCDREGKRAPLNAEHFMVVAPYNDQVHLLREVLDSDERTARV